MDSTNLKTYNESLSCRVERKFTYNWTIYNFDCQRATDGEILPSTKFEFDYGPNRKFSGQLYLEGDTCLKRQCILLLESTTLDKWGVCVDLDIDSDMTENYDIVSLNQTSKKAIWDLKQLQKRCPLIKRESITINCTIIYAIYTGQNRSTSPTNLITSDASNSHRIEKQFTYKWTIEDFHCQEVTIGESLPYTRFKINFGPGAKFNGQLYLQGDECLKRQCILELENKNLENWRVWIDFGFDDAMAHSYGVALNETSSKAIYNLFGKGRDECHLVKCLRNNTVTIKCLITYTTYYKEKYDLPQLKLICQDQLQDKASAQIEEQKRNSEASSINLKTSCCYRCEKKFVYKWTIEGFHCEKVTNGESLPSTEFEVSFGPNTKFSGQLYLVGDNCKERQCMLDLKSTTHNSWKVLVDLGFAGDTTKSYAVALNESSGKAMWPLSSLKRNCELIKWLRNNSVLTIVCRITYVTYKKNKPADINEPAELNENKIIRDATHTCRIERMFTHKWTIKDFDCQKVPSGEILPLTRFGFKFGLDTKFEGQLYLYGDECKSRECVLDLKCETLDNWIVRVVLSLGHNKTKNYDTILNQDSNQAVWPLLTSLTDECLLNKFLHNNKLTITCQIFYVTYEESKPSIASPAELYETKMNWDLIFVVEGHELHAHKFILADRSKVFAAMFKRSMDESNKVTVNDVDLEVFEELLRYIYTNEVVKVTWQLLAASVKYDLPQLKAICENELKRRVSIESVAEHFVMSDIYNNSELKKHFSNYIKENLVAVTKTEGWLNFIKKHCNLFAEIF